MNEWQLIVTGRCSHICNAGFLTTSAARGKGVGIAMGETYLDFAPRLVRPCSTIYQVVKGLLADHLPGLQILCVQPGVREQHGVH